MRMVQAILDSTYLHVDPYVCSAYYIIFISYIDAYVQLHQLMPPILTCLVGKNLSDNPMSNHWELRDFAATLVALICKRYFPVHCLFLLLILDRYGTTYHTIQPRITKTLTHALQDFSKPLTTHYGAIVGIAALGRILFCSVFVHWLIVGYRTQSSGAIITPKFASVHQSINPRNPIRQRHEETRSWQMSSSTFGMNFIYLIL